MTTVCIPLGDQARGGLYTFLRGLRSYCVEHGITLTERMEDDYDALLVPAFMVPYDEVLRIKRRPRGPIIVHRIDGAAQTTDGSMGPIAARHASIFWPT